MLSIADPLGAERIALAAAAGRVLAAPITARAASPRTAVSAMDGYAVRGADVAAPGARLRLIGESTPGSGFDRAIAAGETVRVFTGSPVPAGADRVVVQEDVRREGDTAVFDKAASGPAHIRAAGSGFEAGDVLVDAGRALDPRAMVAAGAADRAKVEVLRRPRVVVLSAGEELCEPGSAHLTGLGVPESLSLGVAAMSEVWGGTCIDRRRLTGDLGGLKAAARQALEDADVVVVAGGASAGERDLARAMFEDCDLELIFSGVQIRPGGLVWLGGAMDRLVLGLPGNPAWAMVTARLFLAPLLSGLAGRDPTAAMRWMWTELGADLPAVQDRERFFLGRWEGQGVAPVAGQESGSQKSLAEADVLIRRRALSPAAEAGEGVEVLEFDPGGLSG